MFKKRMRLCLAVFLICIGIAAYAEGKSPTRVVSEKLITQIDFSSWIAESFRVSPDSKRVAYLARVGNKCFVVVDGKEERQYDSIIVAIPGVGGGRVIFDSSGSIHYLSLKGIGVYLVEEMIK